MGYQRPVPYSRSTSWASHRRRTPPSSEPGIDMFCAIGTPVLAAESGRVVDTGDSIGPATGRFVTIDLDDGHRVRYLHLRGRTVSVGDRVERAQVIGYSGATGYGEEDWSWNPETGGAHVHMTLWLSHRYIFGANGSVDPEPYFDPEGSPSSTGGSAPTIINKSWEDDMLALGITDKNGTVHYATIALGIFRHLIQSDDPNLMMRRVTSDDQWTWVEIDELPALFHTFGIEKKDIYRVEPDGQFVVLNSADGVVRAGGMFRQR